MTDQWINSAGSLDHKGKLTAISSSADQVVAITQILKFVSRMATRSAPQTVVEAGVLDVILRVYIRFPTLGAKTAHDLDHKSALLQSCQSLLGICVAETPSVFEHPVCSLWTECNAQPTHPPAYGDETGESPITRRAAWRRTPGALTRQRLTIILGGSTWNSNSGTYDETEAYCDLVEFTRHVKFERAGGVYIR